MYTFYINHNSCDFPKGVSNSWTSAGSAYLVFFVGHMVYFQMDYFLELFLFDLWASTEVCDVMWFDKMCCFNDDFTGLFGNKQNYL